MRIHVIRQVFAISVSAPLFVALAWFFGVFLQPQGETGAGFALILILASAIAAIWLYAWLMRPGRKVRFRNRGVDGFDRDWGVGLTGLSQHQSGRRRRDDTDGDDLGGRRNSGDMDDGGDEVGLA
ncbi:hypothetical protein AWH62_14745 [Maricaulis sp. W15]|uniref:Uncharacterized protein n=1 Tax=Maricaulis maris TaxID=74318 RepID=A0A495CW30_9PROT|nr:MULTISPECIES: hypothetical protein [Maricaulis]OLF80754.1 hypothetical protein AWH62_14745 [Maricaulis sp. W15]RKQ89576.1 hypothetical protein C7435_3278 [Maricaulis maris]